MLLLRCRVKLPRVPGLYPAEHVEDAPELRDTVNYRLAPHARP